MNIASELLLGSTRVDAWRKEISTTVSIVLGFLEEEDVASMPSRVTVLDETDYYRWTATRGDDNKLSFRLYRIDQLNHKTDHICTLPGEQVLLKHVGFVHHHLDALVGSMQKLIPALGDRWRKLLEVAKDEFHICYQIKFREPAPDSRFPDEQENGREVVFRKKSDLQFPLPLDTEVFVGLQGEPLSPDERPGRPDETDCFFRVTGYEAAVSDSYGDLKGERLVIVLEPKEGWEKVPHSDDFPHFLNSNGWEQH